MVNLLSKDDGIELQSLTEEQRVTSISPRLAWLTFVGLATFLWLVREILLPFVIAAAAAFVLSPVVDRLSAKFAVRRWVSAAGVALLLLGIIALIGFIVAPIIIHDFFPLISNLKSNIAEAAQRFIGKGKVNILGQPMDAAELSQKAILALDNWLGQNGDFFRLAAIGVAVTFGSILQCVLFVYFLVGGPQIKAGLIWLIPPNQRATVEAFLQAYEPILRRYLVGMAIVVAFTATAAYIGLGAVLHIEHAILLALLTGFLEIIPVVGPAASASIAGVAAIHSASGIGAVIAYAIYAVFLRISIDQVIGPLVLGRAAQVNPVLIIFCFLAGGLLFSLPGVLLAVPLALAIKIVLAMVYAEPLVERIRKRHVDN